MSVHGMFLVRGRLTAGFVCYIMYLYLIQILICCRFAKDRPARAGSKERRCMDTRFSVAVHVLILISEAPGPMTSEQMAESVGTNASYVRKILTFLKRAEIVNGQRGIGGYSLSVAPEQLSLLQIYQAVLEDAKIHLLDVHQNASDQCVVGRHIRPVLGELFADMEEAFVRALADKTLADCIAGIRQRME